MIRHAASLRRGRARPGRVVGGGDQKAEPSGTRPVGGPVRHQVQEAALDRDAPFAKRFFTPSAARCFLVLTWFGRILCGAALPGSPFHHATLALKSPLNRRRVLIVHPSPTGMAAPFSVHVVRRISPSRRNARTAKKAARFLNTSRINVNAHPLTVMQHPEQQTSEHHPNRSRPCAGNIRKWTRFLSSSRKPGPAFPITRQLAEILERRRAVSSNLPNGLRDWVFPSPTSATGHVEDIITSTARRISKAVERSSGFMGPPLAERIAA